MIISNFIFFACEKNGSGTKIKAKLVHSSCASDVVQILDPSHYNLGQSSWQLSSNTPVYQHVFLVQNECSFKNENLKAGDEFYFLLTNTNEEGCSICQL